MSELIQMDFSFRSDRKYVHGTDIYKWIMQHLAKSNFSNWDYFELNIKKVTAHNMFCVISNKKKRLSGEVSNFKAVRGNTMIYGSLLENIESPVDSRYEFNERKITDAAIVDQESKTISYRLIKNSTPHIDAIVSLSRYYLYNVIDGNTNWFYRTTKFYYPIDDLQAEKLVIKEVLRKKSFVVFDFYFDGDLAGHAYGASLGDK